MSYVVFSNIPPTHDVAVVSLVAPLFATVGQLVSINVTVANEGSYNEDVSLTVYNETTVIDTTAFTLEKGPTSNTSSFSWNTSGLATAWYTINATATNTHNNAYPTKKYRLEIRHQRNRSLLYVKIFYDAT